MEIFAAIKARKFAISKGEKIKMKLIYEFHFKIIKSLVIIYS